MAGFSGLSGLLFKCRNRATCLSESAGLLNFEDKRRFISFREYGITFMDETQAYFRNGLAD